MKIRMLTPPATAQGAHKFAKLLQDELRRSNEVVPWDDERPCDVAVARGGLPRDQVARVKSLGEKLAIQYGGGDFSPNSAKALREALQAADLAIYNSRYGEQFVRNKLGGSYCAGTVIHNGTVQYSPAPLRSSKCIIACDNYHIPCKYMALRWAIDAVQYVRKHNSPNAELMIVGKLSADTQLPLGCTAVGHLRSHEELQELRQTASVMIHLVEEDNCPNTVVETLGQGIPVICHQNSGTPELVRYFGASCKNTQPENICQKMLLLFQLGPKWQAHWMGDFARNLSIEAIAEKYELTLRRLLQWNTSFSTF